MSALPRSDRARLARLDTVLADVTDFEKAALWKLRQAGWDFTSIQAARNQQTLIRRAAEQQRESLLVIEDALRNARNGSKA